MKTPNTIETVLSAPDSVQFTKMPKLTARQMRACTALFNRPMMREELDRAAGCSNSPDMVMRLIKKGVGITCTEVKRVDRDGRACWPGRYELTDEGRATLTRWGWGVAQDRSLLGESSQSLTATA